MLTLARLERRSRGFARLVGLTPEQFHLVLETFTPLWLEAERARLSHPYRRRAIGAGNKHKLALPERLLVTLLYLRQYATQHLLGVLFDLDDANVCRNINATLPVLEQALPGPIRARTLQANPDEPPAKGSVLKKRRRIGTLEEFLKEFPELEDLIVDSSEQERGQPKPARKTPEGKRQPGRPVDKRKFYSKKAGTHTLKVQVAVTPEGVIAHQSASAPGKMHDTMLLRRSRLGQGLPKGVRLIGDKGYTGMSKVYPEREVVTPTKRPKGKDHTEDEREFNKQVSKVRIVVENALCRVRKYRVCGDFYRGRTEKHGLYWGVVSGLVNLRRLEWLAGLAA